MSTNHQLTQSWMEETRALLKRRGLWNKKSIVRMVRKTAGRAYRVSYLLVRLDVRAGVDPELKITSKRVG
jgi:hypothetical protein